MILLLSVLLFIVLGLTLEEIKTRKKIKYQIISFNENNKTVHYPLGFLYFVDFLQYYWLIGVLLLMLINMLAILIMLA